MYSLKLITDTKVWDNFIDSCKPSSFLHASSWAEVEEGLGRKPHRFGVFDSKGKQVAAVLAVVMKARRGSMLIVPHGPVMKGDASFKDVITAMRDELKKLGKEEGCVVIRVCPITLDSQEHRADFKKLGFRPSPIHVYSELSWILDITPTEEKLLAAMKKNTRYGIRKAERDGITIESSDKKEDIEIFWKIYDETAKRQSFVPYTKKMIAREFDCFGKNDRARWYFAYYKGEAVSTALIVFGAHSAFYHHGASLQAHSAITPSELLQWRVIQDAKARGLECYNFWGVVPDEQVNHPWAGLSRFKKGFGGAAEEYIHAQDYPLSWKYGITYIIEIARKWKRGV